MLSLPVSAMVMALHSSGEHFIALCRSRTKGTIQRTIGDKGYYVCCNIHFPNNNVREGEVMRAEQYYPSAPSHHLVWFFSLGILCCPADVLLFSLLTFQFLLSPIAFTLLIFSLSYPTPIITTENSHGNMTVLLFQSIIQSLCGWNSFFFFFFFKSILLFHAVHLVRFLLHMKTFHLK